MKTIYRPARIVADELGVPRHWLEKEAREGRLPSLRAGRRLLFDAGAVEEALRERTKASAAPVQVEVPHV